MVLVVTEPTLSGLHDLQRVADLTAHFSIPTGVCVNKYDLNQQISDEIKAYCAEHEISFIGEIPYDLVVVEALVHQRPVIEYSQDSIGGQIRRIWQQIEQQLHL
jgi:MinD superfamily P-loop ATPase